jgi:hypothetical protein
LPLRGPCCVPVASNVIRQIEMTARVQLSPLLDAYEWASATGPYENAAYVSRESGQIWLVSDFDDMGEEPPEDAGDESLYVTVPNKNELDLGRNLALRFADEQLPQYASQIRGFFSKPGAYAKLKDLLDAQGVLEAWYAYESAGVQEALRAWAAENDLELVEEAR